MPHSARSLPPCCRHTRLTIVRRGCKRKRIVGAHGEAMYTAPDCAARAALQAQRRQWRGQGARPLAFSWGFKGAILSRERMAPFARFPASGGENSSPFGTQKRRDHRSVVPNFLQLAEALRNDRRRVSGRQRTGVKVKIIPLRRAPGLVGVALVILAALLVHLAD